MAYAPEDEQKKQDQTQAGQVPPTTSSAPGAGPGSSGGKTAQAPQAAPAQPFQNLQSYLGANQPQVQSQADKTAGQLQNTYGQTTGAIDQAKTDYGTQVKAGYAGPNQDIVNQATADPTAFAAKPENVKAFQSLYNDQYTGPNDFESSGAYGDLSGKVNKATSDANLVSRIPGLQTYYQGQNQNATKGGNILDSVLMQGSPEAYGKVTDAAKQFGGLQDYLGGATTDVDKSIQDAKAQATATSTGLQNQFTGAGGVIPSLEGDLTNKLNQTRTDQGALGTKAIQDFQAGNLTPDEAKMLGLDMNNLSDQALSRFGQYGTDLNNDYGVKTNWDSLFTKNNPDVVYQSPGSVATPEEIQKAQALGQLTGQDLSSYLGATSPNGSMVNTNKQGLTDLKENLNSRDSDQVLKYASLFGWDNTPGAETPSTAQFAKFLAGGGANGGDLNSIDPRVGGSRLQAIYDAAKSKGDTTTMNAIDRMGGKRTGASPVSNPNDRRDPTSLMGQPMGAVKVGQDGTQQWFNGQNWVPAPQEIKYEGDKTLKFDYSTGKYNEVSPGTGIVKASSVPVTPSVPAGPAPGEPIPQALPDYLGKPPIGSGKKYAGVF